MTFLITAYMLYKGHQLLMLRLTDRLLNSDANHTHV
jgi:hypothetical protein